VLNPTPSPTCAACQAPLSIDGFDPARKELRCGGCGIIAVIVRGGAPLGSIPLPRGLRVTTGATLVVTWSRPVAWLALAVGGALLIAALFAAERAGILALAGLIVGGGGGYDLWRQPVVRAGADVVAAKGGAMIARDDLDQLYVRKGLGGYEVRATDRQGGDWPLLEVDTLWDALAVEHLIEGHLGISDAPVGR
jgi:hypothetical protein